MATCEIITTGTELLLGAIVNTHPNYLAPKLLELGIRVARVTTVGDERPAIKAAVSEAINRADLVIVTGGLGPTSDDHTREVVAELLNRPLRHDEAIMERIRERFRARNLPVLPAIAVQAQVPEGARVLLNDNGTAPGLALEEQSKLIVLLPGPPRELKPMFENHVVPLLRERGCAQPVECRLWRTVGVGESFVAELVEPIIQGQKDVEIGYCARPNEVDVRLMVRGANARERAEQLGARIHEKLQDIIFGGPNDRLEDAVVRELIRQKKTIATAESCTGGLLASRLTNVSGSSETFIEGVVCYSNEAKQRLVGVRPDTLKSHGAVSEPVARELAEGIRSRAGTDVGVGITGIAGPTGGTREKPVGLVYVALADRRGTEVKRAVYKLDRETFKFVVTQTALDMVRRALRG
jgi:nicotinamide-nucleotide amidase